MAALSSLAGAPKQIHQALLTAYGLSDQRYSLNQLCYDPAK